MTVPKNQQRKKFGHGEILQKASPAMASSLSSCLEEIKTDWKKKQNNVAGLWQEWSQIAGEPLASNCRPLSLRRGNLVVGASHPQWLQALLYNRMKLLASLRSKGYEIRDIRIQQYHSVALEINKESEISIWERHPSRVDIHGITKCANCSSPTPSGEMALWGMCMFCRRKTMSPTIKNNN